ncbi:DUF2905 domain-containing protein [Thermocrinis minervae]|uniref:DUF2905 domain-containing protein n=1 Tax=Thermocrinis minervae TaxID=381751 RepID=A0A1M6Q051_9AQUI|nr:DUF2905 domain-containing protein [Thermocrinis minervae]SHK13569.1 Protein of unknown function [Thermocrinis minervae]
MSEMGKLLILFGSLLILVGLLLTLSEKIPFIGKLPGDIVIKKDGLTVYIPIATSILLSLLLTLLLNLLFRRP